MLLLENVSVLTKENRFHSFYIIPEGALFHEGVYEELAKKYANVKDKLLPDRGIISVSFYTGGFLCFRPGSRP